MRKKTHKQNIRNRKRNRKVTENITNLRQKFSDFSSFSLVHSSQSTLFNDLFNSPSRFNLHHTESSPSNHLSLSSIPNHKQKPSSTSIKFTSISLTKISKNILQSLREDVHSLTSTRESRKKITQSFIHLHT